MWLAGHGRPGTADDPGPGRWSHAIAASMLNGQPTIMAGIHEGGMIDIWNLRSRSHDQIDIGSSILALAVHPSQEIAVGTSDRIALNRLRHDRT